MKIKINQSLHGYENGHQLLACSMELNTLLKKVLLFQTDLSGSNISKGFETYITGYPIEENNLYAFSRTWYADEMKRPGCVWTHTFLIDFSDLSLIQEFQILLDLFKRPIAGEFTSYNNVLEIETEQHFERESLDDYTLKKVLLDSLYKTPEKTIFVPSSNPQIFEKTITSLWSDQWPRLRRNFLFCTGALSIKTLNGREFDLQIIPKNLVSNVEKQAVKPLILDPMKKSSSSWINILGKYEKTEIRKFLWTYGAELDGARKNYFPLLTILDSVYSADATLLKIATTLVYFFPEDIDARLLKTKLFGKDSILLYKFSDKSIIEFLLINEFKFIDNLELHIEERLIELLKNHEIPLSQFKIIWERAIEGRVSDSVWNNITIPEEELLSLIRQDDYLVKPLIHKIISLVNNKAIWELPTETQSYVLEYIMSQKIDCNWNDILFAMLDVKSSVVQSLYEHRGNSIIENSLTWLNKNDVEYFNRNWAKVVSRHEQIIAKWISRNDKNISLSTSKFIFEYLNFGQIKKLNLSSTLLVKIYEKLKPQKKSDQVFISATVFTLGMDEKLRGGDFVIGACFNMLYGFAANSKISDSIWRIIPKEVNFNDDEEEIDPFFAFFFIKVSRKKQRHVPSWDYCEILVRTITNRFMRENWDKQQLLEALSERIAFKKAVDYCLMFPSGMKFLTSLLDDISMKKISISPTQRKVLQGIEMRK